MQGAAKICVVWHHFGSEHSLQAITCLGHRAALLFSHFLLDHFIDQMAEAAGDAAAQHIQLKVKDQQGSEVQFKIKKSTPLRKLMDAYCSRLGLQASQVRFMVDGERIAADDTAEKLGLEDEDLIDVAMEQTGGCE
ncbi:unnamed protein product [Polarella glacialis]|uniref:Ubiquitin-like domain-containing protein n=1 Tax=Polarella glacialis TaxID=89957 RepID=A0A813FKK4_POLGL|nr:unnamed protein product [Polarella glacialis]CAE8612542.1 unnamed protein product [Polarella glacialis]CAE8686765.1 unnamed protein product [Polarella glacialis]CAE8723370.1 unnamed protein product [Polarella glacialis]